MIRTNIAMCRVCGWAQVIRTRADQACIRCAVEQAWGDGGKKRPAGDERLGPYLLTHDKSTATVDGMHWFAHDLADEIGTE